MLFDEKRKKGVRRKCLPEPNPTKIVIKKDASLSDVFDRAIELYYKDFSGITNENNYYVG